MIPFDPMLTRALGGLEVPSERQRDILSSLGFTFDGDNVRVPSWRRDVEGPADLVEEVTRIIGYDAIPSTPLPRAEGVAHPTATRAQMMERKVRRAAAARRTLRSIIWARVAVGWATPSARGKGVDGIAS